jgi:PhzF family phenazine biosynthesis protein
MNYSFQQVDVFSSKACLGNPVCVFLESEGLSTEQMQKIARWTNLSETTFVSSSSRADYRVRIFTPGEELPFAGHPTLGTAWALRQAGIISLEHCIQECDFGLVAIHYQNSQVYFELPHYSVEEINSDYETAAAVGLPVRDSLKITTGPRWIVAELPQGSLGDAKIDHAIFSKLMKSKQSTGVTLYSIEGPNHVNVRTFFESFTTIVEDPVCGSGNAAVAAHILATKKSHLVGKSYQAYQGSFVGRDGRISVILGDKIQIGGACSTVFEGVARI